MNIQYLLTNILNTQIYSNISPTLMQLYIYRYELIATIYIKLHSFLPSGFHLRQIFEMLLFKPKGFLNAT